MWNVRVLSNHKGGEKIAQFDISQFYLITINHQVQMIIHIAEFTPKELFFII